MMRISCAKCSHDKRNEKSQRYKQPDENFLANFFGFRGLAVRIEILSSAFGAKRLSVGYCRTALCTAPVFVCVDISAAAWAKALTVIERLAALRTCCGRIIIPFHSLFTLHVLDRCFALLLHNNCADYEEHSECSTDGRPHCKITEAARDKAEESS